MVVNYYSSLTDECLVLLDTVWHKILTGENIDKFDEFLDIRQYFPHQKFQFR